jgi:predicted unusual protein kinase regulating ubiquinone biosynthesis (AarF/ABC1/UbiB family)
LDKQAIQQQVGMGVNQLHANGFAHCDICVDNIFVDANNTVFLGDLEYCQLMIEPPPADIRRAEVGAQTAEALDNIQLQRLADEIASI